MKNLFSYSGLQFLLSFFSAIVLMTACQNNNHSKTSKINSQEKISDKKNRTEADKQDGIAALQKWEFEMTKDVSLGYVPLDRLINATEELKTERRNGTYANRTSALSWTERGSKSDAVGPSNGNLRTAGAVTSGRLRAIWVDNIDGTGKTVWVGGIDGGIWKTTDITASPAVWTPVSDFFANLSVSSICQDPTDPLIMYFGTGEKTFNADAVRGGGVWRSADNGVTWTLLPATTGYFNVSKVLCDAAGNIYVSTVNPTSLVLGAGLYRSTKASAGAVWTNIAPSGMASFISDFEISSTGRLHINVGQSEGAGDLPFCGYRYTSTPATVTPATWTTATTPYPASTEGCELACLGSTLLALRVSGSNVPTIYKSIDGGDTWAATGTTPPFTSGQAWYCLSADINPADATQFIVGSLDNYKSIDGGATWTHISDWVCPCGTTRYIHADQHICKWYAGNKVLFGCDGGVFYSPDGGATVADKNTNLRLKQFYACAIHPTSTNYFLAGAQDNGVHQLNGAGITSSVEVTGGDGAYVHIDEDEPSFQFGSYVYNQYRRSTDGGTSWGSVNYGDLGGTYGQFINPTDYDDVNNNFYGPYTAGNYIRWMNAQAGSSAFSVSVSAITGANKLTHTMVSKYTTNRVFFGSVNGKIIRADNANTATPTLTDITGSTMSASTVSCVAEGTTDNNLLATFSNYGSIHVWVSTVGGGAAGWTNITGSGLPDIPVRWAMFNPEDNTKAILATEMGIYETSLISGGATAWVQNGTLPVVKTNMLQYRFNDNTILASTHGRGLWTSIFTPVAPYVRFASSYTYSPVRTEATASTTGCRSYTDYTLNMHIDKAPTGAAAVTLSIAGGATATLGVDYDFTTNGSFAAPSSVVTFPSGGTADQPITIRVYNDVEVDAAATESFTFNYTIGGGTDALPAPSSTYYTFYIADNDVTPTITAVETVLGRTKTEHVGNNGTYYFYGSTGGLLLTGITGSTGNLGCVTSSIFEAGTTWQPLVGGLRSQKVFDIAPTTNPGSTYTVNLYFTTAELAGQAPGVLKIAKTTAATMALVTAGNTVVASTTSLAYNGANWVFTATFTGFSKFFLINDLVALPVNLLSFSGYLNNQDHSALQWQTTNQFDLNNFEVQRSYDGIQFGTVGTVNAVQNPASIQTYAYIDPLIAKAVNFYRLKMVDRDGRSKYSDIIKINNNKPQKFIDLVQNPVRENISFIINNENKENVSGQLFSSSGQLVKRWELGKINGYVVLPFNGVRPASGIYTLRLSAGNKTENLRISIQ